MNGGSRFRGPAAGRNPSPSPVRQDQPSLAAAIRFGEAGGGHARRGLVRVALGLSPACAALKGGATVETRTQPAAPALTSRGGVCYRFCTSLFMYSGIGEPADGI